MIIPKSMPQIALSKWYLSFADDEGFRGAVVVLGRDLVDAVERSHILGINPGGQVLGVNITDISQCNLPMDRLLSPQDIGEGKKLSDMDNSELRKLGL